MLTLFDPPGTIESPPQTEDYILTEIDNRNWNLKVKNKVIEELLPGNEWLLCRDYHFVNNVRLNTKIVGFTHLITKHILEDLKKILPVPSKVNPKQLGWSMYKAKLIDTGKYLSLYLQDLKYSEGDRLKFPLTNVPGVDINKVVNPIKPFVKPIGTNLPNTSNHKDKLLVGMYNKPFLNYKDTMNDIKVIITYTTANFLINVGKWKGNDTDVILNNNIYSMNDVEVNIRNLSNKLRYNTKVQIFEFRKITKLSGYSKGVTTNGIVFGIDGRIYDIPSITNPTNNLVYVDGDTLYPIEPFNVKMTLYDNGTDKYIYIQSMKSKGNDHFKEFYAVKDRNSLEITIRIESKYNGRDSTFRKPTKLLFRKGKSYIYTYTYSIDAMYIKNELTDDKLIILTLLHIGKRKLFKVIEVNGTLSTIEMIEDKSITGYKLTKKVKVNMFFSPNNTKLLIDTDVSHISSIRVANQTNNFPTIDHEYNPYLYNIKQFTRPFMYSSIFNSYFKIFKVGGSLHIKYIYFEGNVNVEEELKKLKYKFEYKTDSIIFNIAQALDLTLDINTLFINTDINKDTIEKVYNTGMNPSRFIHTYIPNAVM